MEELDNFVLKRKSSMVLFRIEEELGAFVSRYQQDVDRVSDSIKETISSRELERGRFVNKNKISELIQASYLDEVFSIALDITQGTSEHARVERLKSLCAQLGLYEIRNSLAHPNRPFLDSYWYRIASVASDPIIEQLDLYGVRQSLIAAENDQISDPPEEWLKKHQWEIPNNLPERVDHGITGLVGRKSERDSLKKLLEKPRVNSIAVVAPGGLEKQHWFWISLRMPFSILILLNGSMR